MSRRSRRCALLSRRARPRRLRTRQKQRASGRWRLQRRRGGQKRRRARLARRNHRRWCWRSWGWRREGTRSKACRMRRRMHKRLAGRRVAARNWGPRGGATAVTARRGSKQPPRGAEAVSVGKTRPCRRGSRRWMRWRSALSGNTNTCPWMGGRRASQHSRHRRPEGQGMQRRASRYGRRGRSGSRRRNWSTSRAAAAVAAVQVACTARRRAGPCVEASNAVGRRNPWRRRRSASAWTVAAADGPTAIGGRAARPSLLAASRTSGAPWAARPPAEMGAVECQPRPTCAHAGRSGGCRMRFVSRPAAHAGTRTEAVAARRWWPSMSTPQANELDPPVARHTEARFMRFRRKIWFSADL